MNRENRMKRAARRTGPALEHIREDINCLQSDVADAAVELQNRVSDRAHDAVDYVSERLDALKETGLDTMEDIEDRIRDRPGQSIAIAFVAGALSSYLLSRRGNGVVRR